MSAENLELSAETIDSIVESMYGETPQQEVQRLLKDDGVFCYLKHHEQPLPKLSEDSGLMVENAGLIFDHSKLGMIDSFIVYDPRRVEIKIERHHYRDEIQRQIRPGRKSTVDTGSSPIEGRAKAANEGWVTPFPESMGRVVMYRSIQQPSEQ